MVRSSVVLLLGWSFVCATGADAQWLQRDSRIEPSIATGIVHHHIVLENSSTGAEAILELAKFAQKSAHLHLLDNPDGDDSGTALNRENIVAGVNGGYFDENFAPLGLRIGDGRRLSPLVKGRLLTGVVVASGLKIQILRVNEFSKTPSPAMAIQCGPFLIDRGAAVAGLDPKHRARRSFVSVTGAGDIVIGYCSDASLAELPKILIAGMSDTKIQRALNLDGGSSSAFWFKRKDGSVLSIPEQKRVRDFLAVTPR